MKAFICSAKELVLYFVSDWKLIKVLKGWGVKILDAIRFTFQIGSLWQQLEERVQWERLERRPVGSPWDHSRQEMMGA